MQSYMPIVQTFRICYMSIVVKRRYAMIQLDML